MTKILISGIPGTGKTTVSECLARDFGYLHVNMEADSFRGRRELEDDAQAFLDKLSNAADVVLSWGFGPYMDRPAIDRLLAAGYNLIWLDGDHVTTLRTFLAREDGDPRQEANYYGQMQMILATEVAQRVNLTRVDPFSRGDFRSVQEIAAEIIHKLGG